jgi:hypothetical protein
MPSFKPSKQDLPFCRLAVLSQGQFVGQQMIANFVKKKSAIRIAIETTTTVRVVLLPTPAVPPRVVIPK